MADQEQESWALCKLHERTIPGLNKKTKRNWSLESCSIVSHLTKLFLQRPNDNRKPITKVYQLRGKLYIGSKFKIKI